MAIVNSDLTMNWSVLPFGTPNVEFWYPADVPSYYVRIYHGVSNNVPNRRIIKTVKMGISAGDVHNFRNIGYDDELIKLDIVLSTKEEADEFTTFFKDIIKGSAHVFYYRNNFTGQESIVRSMNNSLSMGESEGHPYSFSLLLRKEDPYTGVGLTMKYDVIQSVSYASVFGGHFGSFSMVMVPIASKTLHVAGDNNGQLGLGDYVDRKRFAQVGSATDWVLGSGGIDHAHAVNENGELFSAGLNSYGQLGLGDTATRSTFTKVGSDIWSEISSGVNFTGAVKTDGTLWAWGQNNFGQLGQGGYDFVAHSSPLQLGSATNWVEVRCGAYFLIAKNSDGELWGCGQDGNGQLGQGSTTDRRTSLVKIGTDIDWDLFDAGWAHTVAIKTNGDLYTWGANSRGELGNGTTVEKYTPTKIGSDTWKAIAAGAGGPGSTYGIKVAGTLWSWGMNENYELGIGSSDANIHSSPILINSDTDWRQIFAGGVHGLATKSNNQIWAWGLNTNGECGTGEDTPPISVPTRTFLLGFSVSLVWDVIFSFFP